VTHDPASAALNQLIAALTRTLAEDTAALARLDDLERRVTDLTRRLAQPQGQQSSARPQLDPDEPVTRLRDWVERVYRPGYGHLAVLGPCWPQHQLCLYGLGILCQLWSALYLDPDPESDASLLTAQAEYQARVLPAIAAQLAAETTRCGHPTVTSYPGARQ
jgi:hypothetical protein